MKNELVIVIDFGGQYNQLVARRVASVMYTARFILTRPILKDQSNESKGNHLNRWTKQLL